MNLLIVDDEYFSVENMKSKLDWAQLGFEQVLCAYSMSQAQDIFNQHIIDVLLCDIEMPKGSGLDLLEWIREQKHQTVCIFLTCFAEFAYANKALQLESSDYLLKPISSEELLKAINKAVRKHKRTQTEKTNEIHAEYWLSNDMQRCNSFWREIVESEKNLAYTEIITLLKKHQTSLQIAESQYLPILIKYSQSKDNAWESNLFSFAVKNIVNEILSNKENAISFVKIDGNKLFLPIKCSAEEKASLIKSVYEAHKTCCKVLCGTFHFYIAPICEIEAIACIYKELLQYAYNGVSLYNEVYEVKSEYEQSTDIQRIPSEEWTDLLLNRKTDEVKRRAVDFVRAIACKKTATRLEFTAFYHDFSQILYALLDTKNAPAHKLFANTNNADVVQHACDSLQNIESWIIEILTSYYEIYLATTKTGSVIEEVKTYIIEHLEEDINRNTLAQAVYLSPDYLSHLFREKTNTSLTNFIANERIKKAKQLLNANSLSIRDVALASGFQNISYFSKQFKRATGQTPQDFRKRD